MGWGVKVDLSPSPSISTYGKIISSNGKSRARQTQVSNNELLVGMDDDDDRLDPAAEAKRELHSKEPPPPRASQSNNPWIKGRNRPSACFLKKGKPVDRAGRAEDTPGPTHYNPRFTLTKNKKPAAFVSSTKNPGLTLGSNGSELPSGEASEEGHRTVVGSQRTDRLASTRQPWLKNPSSEGRPTSAFLTTKRKPLHDGEASEIGSTPNESMVRPRSAKGYISLGGGVSREQRNKTSRTGHAVGHYTLHLDYNKDFNNDLPMRAKSATPIRMIQMSSRKPLDDRIVQLEKTPGMHKLGRPQAAWGGADGSLGGTGERLIRKKSQFASLDQQSREQKNRTGHTPHAELVDLMYDQDQRGVLGSDKRTPVYVKMEKSQQRQTIMSHKTEGADKMYNWTKTVDKRTVPVPNFSNTPTREQRKKAGFGSYSDPPVDTVTDPKKLMKCVASRVPGVDMRKSTSRDPPSIIPPDKYKDQLMAGQPVRLIGEMSRSPVRGSPPFSPDFNKMSKRKTEPGKGKKGPRRFGG